MSRKFIRILTLVHDVMPHASFVTLCDLSGCDALVSPYFMLNKELYITGHG